DGAGAGDMDPVEIALEDAHQIDHPVGAVGDGGERRWVAEIGADELGLAEPAQRLQEISATGLALGDADAKAGAEQRLGDVAADKAAAAEQGDEPLALNAHGS